MIHLYLVVLAIVHLIHLVGEHHVTESNIRRRICYVSEIMIIICYVGSGCINVVFY